MKRSSSDPPCQHRHKTKPLWRLLTRAYLSDGSRLKLAFLPQTSPHPEPCRCRGMTPLLKPMGTCFLKEESVPRRSAEKEVVPRKFLCRSSVPRPQRARPGPSLRPHPGRAASRQRCASRLCSANRAASPQQGTCAACKVLSGGLRVKDRSNYKHLKPEGVSSPDVSNCKPPYLAMLGNKLSPISPFQPP